jgi:hypothetical protein
VKSGAPFVAGWGLWLVVLATMLWIWSGDELPAGLLTGAAVGWLLIALFVALRAAPTGPRILLESSLATVVVVIGASMMLNGLEFGKWLFLIGAEVAVLGLAGLAVELVDLRRERGRR